MLIYEKELSLPVKEGHTDLLRHTAETISDTLDGKETPVRFVITKTDGKGYRCELGVLSGAREPRFFPEGSIFNLYKRRFERTGAFTAVFLVPTGIGAEIGGHSGDSGAVARLLASACDLLVTHPNVANAADINELPENALYVEGSVISRLLLGSTGLQRVRSNRVMVIVGSHPDETFFNATVNSVSAARAAFGLDCPIVARVGVDFSMRSSYTSSGSAAGRIKGFECLCRILEKHRDRYDAVAVASLVDVPHRYHADYFKDDAAMVNPWGGVEAMLTHTVSMLFDIPSAHAPMMTSKEIWAMDLGIVDPRKSAEAVSVTYFHSVLKGLARSPRIVSCRDTDGYSPGLLTAADISCLVVPYGCVGLPTLAALEQDIPVIAVRENKNLMANRIEDLPFTPGKLFVVENYLEAAGVMSALKAGVTIESVRRPLGHTPVYGPEE